MIENLLTVRDLRIEGYVENEWQPIVEGIDLTLNKGRVLGLIGESGAGKTSIGLAAIGHYRPGCRIASGSVTFDGIEIGDASDETMRKLWGSRLAYVAQSAAAAFNPAHRLLRQCIEGPVQHGLMNHTRAEEIVRSLYRRLDLPEPHSIGNRFPHQVSGGQLQRVMVAMALCSNPDVIVFDEPTTALDVTTQIEVLSAIKEVVREFDLAAIYITHDLAVIAQLADYIMVLRDGQLIEEGEARDILERPSHEYTKQLLTVRSNRKVGALQVQKDDVVLEVVNLTANYIHGINVLEEIDLKVGRGTTVAVVGESGSGKSSLARAITGLLPPSRGQVLFDGEELPPKLKSRTRESLRKLQLIYQMPDLALNPRQRVRDIVGRPLAFYFGMKGAALEARVAELLEKTELPSDYAERFPMELSGGEKQRICIARALAAEPEVIICDEVTSALDQLVAYQLLTLLQDLQNDLGVSYLFITHDLATVKAISDDVIVMHKGRIVEQGTRDEVFSPPHHTYTELLLSSVPEMDPDWLDSVLEKRRAS